MCKDAGQEYLAKILGVQHFGAIPEIMVHTYIAIIDAWDVLLGAGIGQPFTIICFSGYSSSHGEMICYQGIMEL